MEPLTLLRELVGAADPARAMPGTLPIRELRFVLEYAEAAEAQAHRGDVAALLGSDAFFLEPLVPGDVDNPFLVLRVPGVEAVVGAGRFFEMGYAVQEALGLVSCEPDIVSQVYADPDAPDPGRAAEGADVIGGFCWVNRDAPADTLWALETIRADKAWLIDPDAGAGIIVAQPDTGVGDHVELSGALRLDLARDVMADRPGARDPLDPRTANPGHGTATASVVASRKQGRMTGSAPGAFLVPIRCIEDVKCLNGAPVARAIAHARSIGAHVVTMSLGGIPSRAMRREIRAAINDGMIILAAAGNCVAAVVWPAAYPEVIAVGGTNDRDQRWRGSSRGSTVDICAPAEMVWRAKFDFGNGNAPGVAGGQGTSYAVALTAGVAALWLSHHGRDAVVAEAARRGVPVQELFRMALRSEARVEQGWDTANLGAGIVDAEALLKLALPDISGARVRDADDGISGALTQRRPMALPGNFDWTRFGAEAASLMLDDARFGRFSDMAGAETARGSHKPSPSLQQAMAEIGTPAVMDLIGAGTDPTAEHRPPPPLGDVAERALKILARPENGPLESAINVRVENARASLDDALIRRRLDRVERGLAHIDTGVEAQAIRRDVLNESERVLRAVRDGGAGVRLDRRDRVVLEALVKLDGRPVVRVADGTVDVEHPQLQEWQGEVVLLLPEIEQMQASVGRIDAEGVHAGTGFVVGEGLVLTNRHVLETFGIPVPARHDPDRWIVPEDAGTINFSDTARVPDRTFRIKGVAYAGPSQITGEPIIFSDLDLALLDVETTNAQGETLPPALNMRSEADLMTRPGRLFMFGYPALPRKLPRDKHGRINRDVTDRLRALFGFDYGTKYLSMGIVEAPTGTVPDDPSRWVFAHDATTLGGNSGSCVVHVSEGMPGVAGLHFAGDWLHANYAHGLAAVAGSKVMDAQILSRMGLAHG